MVYQLRCRLNELCSLSLEWKEKTCDIPTGRTMSDSWGPTASDIAGARRLQSQVHWTAQYDDDALDTILEGVLPNDLDVPGHPSTPAGADDDADDDELEDDPDMYGLSDVDEEDFDYEKFPRNTASVANEQGSGSEQEDIEGWLQYFVHFIQH